MTPEEKRAYEWALKQEYPSPSIAVCNARALALYVQRATIAHRAAVEAEREACAVIVDNQLACYPGDIFIEPPPGKHGQTVDACSARALRAILPVVAERIRARAQTDK